MAQQPNPQQQQQWSAQQVAQAQQIRQQQQQQQGGYAPQQPQQGQMARPQMAYGQQVPAQQMPKQGVPMQPGAGGAQPINRGSLVGGNVGGVSIQVSSQPHHRPQPGANVATVQQHQAMRMAGQGQMQGQPMQHGQQMGPKPMGGLPGAGIQTANMGSRIVGGPGAGQPGMGGQPGHGAGGGAGPVAGQPGGAQGGEVGGAPKVMQGDGRILSKQKLQELVAYIDKDERLDADAEDLLMLIADEFVESVTSFACKIAKHRRSAKLETKDLQFHLDHNWGIRVAGFGAADEDKGPVRLPMNDAHRQRMSAVKRNRSNK